MQPKNSHTERNRDLDHGSSCCCLPWRQHTWSEGRLHHFLWGRVWHVSTVEEGVHFGTQLDDLHQQIFLGSKSWAVKVCFDFDLLFKTCIKRIFSYMLHFQNVDVYLGKNRLKRHPSVLLSNLCDVSPLHLAILELSGNFLRQTMVAAETRAHQVLVCLPGDWARK